MKNSFKRREAKAEIFAILKSSSSEQLKDELGKFPRIPLINSLFMALCDANELIKWHAVSAFGEFIPEMAKEDAESARVIMRRFLWTLNDESGGIGWGAPESMAMIMCNSDLLRQEYLHMLISYMRDDGEELFQDGNFLELPLLQRGLLWGVGTLCQRFPDEMRERGAEEDLAAYLDSNDHEVRVIALWALSNLQVKVPASVLESAKDLPDSARLYINGRFEEIATASIVSSLQVN